MGRKPSPRTKLVSTAEIAFTLAIAAIIIASTSVVTAIPFAGHAPAALNVAYAQPVATITFETSAVDHGNRFFGEALVKVVITDPDSDDDSTVEDLTVDITADPQTGSTGSSTFAIPETSASSGRFELYIAHQDADEVDPDEIDPVNSAGVEGATGAGATAAPIITFGPTGDLDADSDLYEETSFELTAGNSKLELEYEETPADLELDRTAYGSNSFIYIRVKDPDANLNPTATDEFTVDPSAAPNSDLFVLDGGDITQSVVFEETGDNTAVFEGRYRLGSSIDADSEALVLTLFDKANYGADLDAPENDSNDTDEVSFVIGDDDGGVSVGGGNGGGDDNGGQQPDEDKTFDPKFTPDKGAYDRTGDVARITIEDPDANASPSAPDFITVKVFPGRNDTGSSRAVTILAFETGANTSRFDVAFELVAEGGGGATTTLKQLVLMGSDDGFGVQYTDKKPADYAEKVARDENPEKDFTFSVGFGQLDTGATTPSRPVAKDTTGREIGSLVAGQQIVLSTTIENNNDEPRPFVAIVEVRDSDDFTVYLQWQTGTLNPSGQTEVGLSWTPAVPDSYEVRTFVVSEFANPQALSPVAQSTLSIK